VLVCGWERGTFREGIVLVELEEVDVHELVLLGNAGASGLFMLAAYTCACVLFSLAWTTLDCGWSCWRAGCCDSNASGAQVEHVALLIELEVSFGKETSVVVDCTRASSARPEGAALAAN